MRGLRHAVKGGGFNAVKGAVKGGGFNVVLCPWDL